MAHWKDRTHLSEIHLGNAVHILFSNSELQTINLTVFSTEGSKLTDADLISPAKMIAGCEDLAFEEVYHDLCKEFHLIVNAHTKLDFAEILPSLNGTE